MIAESLSSQMYARLKAAWTGEKSPRRSRKRSSPQPGPAPFTAGRDPLSVGETLGIASSTLGWDLPLAQAELIAAWAELVGEDTASNTRVESFDNGELRVRCASTAWATQLTLMTSAILTKASTAHPNAELISITFLGPNAPSWKRGLKSVPGRGARDTYG